MFYSYLSIIFAYATSACKYIRANGFAKMTQHELVINYTQSDKMLLVWIKTLTYAGTALILRRNAEGRLRSQAGTCWTALSPGWYLTLNEWVRRPHALSTVNIVVNHQMAAFLLLDSSSNTKLLLVHVGLFCYFSDVTQSSASLGIIIVRSCKNVRVFSPAALRWWGRLK